MSIDENLDSDEHADRKAPPSTPDIGQPTSGQATNAVNTQTPSSEPDSPESIEKTDPALEEQKPNSTCPLEEESQQNDGATLQIEEQTGNEGQKAGSILSKNVRAERIKSFAKRWACPLSFCVLALLAILMLVNELVNHVNVREPGAWPDVSYLATLTSEPEQFMKALNCPEATEAYNQAKADNTSTFRAPLDITELTESNSDPDRTKEVEIQITLSNDQTAIDNYVFLYTSTAPVETPLYLTEENYPAKLQGLTACLELFQRAKLAAQIGCPLSEAPGLTSSSYQECLDSAFDDFATADSTTYYYLDHFDELLANINVGNVELNNFYASYGTASWQDGLSKAMENFFRATPTATTGENLTVQGDELDGGSILINIGDFDYFTWAGSTAADFEINNIGSIAIGYYSEPLSIGIDAQSYLLDTNLIAEDDLNTLWSFENALL